MASTIKEIREQNLKILIIESGLSQGAFALKVETAPAYISQIFSTTTKRSMGDLVARKIEQKMNIPKGWMDTPHQTNDTKDILSGNSHAPNDKLLGILNLYDDTQAGHPDQLFLSFINPEQLMRGPHRTEMTEHAEHKLPFSKSLLNKLGIAEAAAKGAVVEGNSMAPVLPDGSLLAVDTDNIKIKDGEIYAINHLGNLRIKMLYTLPGGSLRLRSFNNQEWPDEHILPADIHQIVVLGRVFWWSVLR
jgi:hypothetical protein